MGLRRNAEDCREHVARINDPHGEAVCSICNIKNQPESRTNVFQSESHCGRIIDPRYIILTGTKAEAAFRPQAMAAYEQRLKEFRDPKTEF